MTKGLLHGNGHDVLRRCYYPARGSDPPNRKPRRRPASLVSLIVDGGFGRVLLDGFGAVEGTGLGLVALASGDDLAVGGFGSEPEPTSFVLVKLELPRHWILSTVARIRPKRRRQGGLVLANETT